jgi:hypothetical protein
MEHNPDSYAFFLSALSKGSQYPRRLADNPFRAEQETLENNRTSGIGVLRPHFLPSQQSFRPLCDSIRSFQIFSNPKLKPGLFKK